MAIGAPNACMVALLIFAVILSPAIPCNAAIGLTYRELLQKPSCPPCLCCQTAIPPPCCYCACFVTQSGTKVP
ncbi:hypothetical protein Pfo_012176 [Paulownia fortunei]|nr:hypothetical protein Pfo_012176 [Paulownia fortunei]